ncbi:MAG: AraC family transcriptional activator of pobA [Flavobacteriaceae bacterium]|jgi:AraC family transcriptional activator of pobA
MIPIHASNSVDNRKVAINKLSKLNDYDFTEAHRHDYFELFFFEDGGGVHIIDFQEIAIQSNSIHIVAPGQVHQMRRELDSSGYVFLFGLDAVQHSPEIEGFLIDQICAIGDERTPTYVMKTEERELMAMLLEESWASNKSKDIYHQSITINALERLCIQCMKLVKPMESYKANEYGEFRRMLFTSYKEKRKVQDYVDELNISAKSLNELVKKHTGKNVSQHIYDQVILEAKRLLLLGGSAKEVGYELKFEDPAHFSKFFKAQTGSSPSDFLKVHR